MAVRDTSMNWTCAKNQERSGIQDLEDPGSGILTDPRSFFGICRRIQWIWIISTQLLRDLVDLGSYLE